MNSKFKAIVNQFIPPVIFRLRKTNSDLSISGNYVSWNQATAASIGYDSEIILNKTQAALLKVKNGEAVYERDSVLFNETQFAWPLLAGMMWVAAKSSGKLNVLDFGGSLGSTYFQNRVFLESLSEVHWNIVEQPRHVEVGKEFFEDERLKFFSSISDCLSASQPNVVILSSVLQYLERPYKVLSDLMELDCEHIIIDRTPFWHGPADRLCIQHVPPSIYPASYPIWILSKSRFLSEIRPKGFKLISEFESLDCLKGPVALQYKGMIVVKSQK